MYLKQYQYDYPHNNSSSEIHVKRDEEGDYIYIGHLKEGTDERDGIGINVNCAGSTLQYNKIKNIYMRDIGKMTKWSMADIQPYQLISSKFNFIEIKFSFLL